MKSLIRAIVSASNQTHHDKVSGLLLDICYITPQLIVASGPVKDGVKSLYRYPIGDLVKYLESQPNSWHIWNFRGEGMGYDPDDVFGKVSYYPFPDHQPPTIEIIYESVFEIYDFVRQNPTNIAVLHCRAGKGRSGTICCAYLIYKGLMEGLLVDPEGANRIFTEKRLRKYSGEGVSIMSQRRYLEYWYTFITSTDSRQQQYFLFNPSHIENWTPKACVLTHIIVKGCNDALLKSKFSSLDLTLDAYKKSLKGAEVREIFRVTSKPKVVGKDLHIVPSQSISLTSSTSDIRVSIKDWCYCWFNVYFETLKSNEFGFKPVSLEKESLLLTSSDGHIMKGHFDTTWDDLDGYLGTRLRGIKLFQKIEVNWCYYY